MKNIIPDKRQLPSKEVVDRYTSLGYIRCIYPDGECWFFSFSKSFNELINPGYIWKDAYYHTRMVVVEMLEDRTCVWCEIVD